MPTPDMSDEELDRMFRHGAEAYPDEVSLTGWLKLEEQLNTVAQQQQVHRQVRRRVLQLLAAELALVLLLAVLWQTTGKRVLWPEEPPVGAREASGPAVIRLQPASAAARVSASPEPARAAATLLLAPEAGSRPGPAAVPGRLPGVRSASGVRRAVGNAARPLVPLVALATPPSGLPEAKTSRKPDRPTLSQSATVPSSDEASAAQQPAANAEKQSVPEAAVMVAADTTPVASSSPAATPNPPAAPADTTQPLPFRYAPRLLVGIAGGPEATAVLPGPAPRLGGAVGLLLEYRLLPRWRVRTGLVRSVKRYAANGADYNPPPDYWTHRIPIDQVNANCRILEIPVDVRYDAILRPTHTFYATAGLTSLLMRNERYNYLYELNGRYVSRTWSLARGSNSAFSLLQLGVGLEHAAGGRWTVQAEPFVKIPLGGVGFGQIQLSSAGVLLGVKYGLFRPRTVAP